MANPSNKAQWQPTIPVDQSIYEDSSTQKAPLGTRLEVGDRTFYYAQAGTAITGGTIVQIEESVADISETAGAAAAIGTTGVTYYTDDAAITKNQFADGYLFVCDGTTPGQLYRVKSNAAIATSGTGEVILYDQVAVAIDTADEISLKSNIYKNVGVSATGLDGMMVGVTPCAVSSGEYFWLQTYGPAAVYMDEAAGDYNYVRAGATGAVAVAVDGTTGGSTTQTIIGKMMQTGVDTEHNLVFLTLRP